MPRRQLTDAERARGERLAQAIAIARTKSQLSQDKLATGAQVPVDSVRKLEQARTPTPGFFLVAALAAQLQVSLDDLAATAGDAT